MHKIVQDRPHSQGKNTRSKSKTKITAHPNYDSYSRYVAQATNAQHDYQNADMLSDLRLKNSSMLSSPQNRDTFDKSNSQSYSNFSQQKMPISLLTSIQKLGGKKHTIQAVKKGRASSSLLCPTASSKNKDITAKSHEKFEPESVKQILGVSQSPYYAQSQMSIHPRITDKAHLEAKQLIQSIQDLAYRGKSSNSREKMTLKEKLMNDSKYRPKKSDSTQKSLKSKLNRSVLQPKRVTTDEIRYEQRATQSSSYLQRSAMNKERHCDRTTNSFVEADEDQTYQALQQATIAHFNKSLNQKGNKKSSVQNKRDSGGSYMHHKVKKMSRDYFNGAEKQRKDSKLVTPFNYDKSNETVTQTKADAYFIDNIRQTPQDSPKKNIWVTDTVNMEPEVLQDLDTELKEKRKKLGNLYLKHSIKQKTRSRSRSKNNSRTKTPEKLISPKNDYQLTQTWLPKRAVTPSVNSYSKRDYDSIPNQYYMNKDYTTFMRNSDASPDMTQSCEQTHNTAVNNDKKSSEKLSKLEMQNKLRFLHQRLGAVFKGYKCRRIYHNNKVIKQYRQEFRDLIQFAYQLKQEIVIQQQSQATKNQMDQTKMMLLTSLKDLISKRHQFAYHFNRLLSGEVSSHYESQTSIQSKRSMVEWMVESKPIQVQNLNSQISERLVTQKSVVNIEDASNSYQYMDDQKNVTTPQNKSPQKRDFNTSQYKKYVHQIETKVDTRNNIMANEPNSIYREETNNYIQRRSIPNRKEDIRESNHTFGKTTLNQSRQESRHQTIQDKSSIQSPTNEIFRSKSQLVIKQGQTTPIRSINMAGERSESRSRSNISDNQQRQGNFQGQPQQITADIQDLGIGLGQQFIKSMYSIKSMNSIKLDCASRDRSLSQTKQRFEEQESQQVLEKKTFLKKGSQSRIYDPNKSIMQEKLAHQESSEIKLSNCNYNSSGTVPQKSANQFQSNDASNYSSFQTKNNQKANHDQSKSPIRSIKKFSREYVSPYSQVRNMDASPIKDFSKHNIDRVKQISELTKLEKMKSETVEQTQNIIQTNLNQRNQGYSLNPVQSEEIQERTFVSKIPRLSQSIGRCKKAEPVERNTRSSQNGAYFSQKKIERISRVSESRAVSSSPHKRVSFSPQKRNLDEMNEMIKEQNKTYVQNLKKKKSPDHSRKTSGAVLADLLMNKGDQTNLQVIQSFSSQTKGMTFSKDESGTTENHNQIGGLSFSRLSRGSLNSKSAQTQKSNNRYHKKEYSDVSQCANIQNDSLNNNKITAQKNQTIQKPEIINPISKDSKNLVQTKWQNADHVSPKIERQMNISQKSNDKRKDVLRSPTPQKKLQEIVLSPSPEVYKQQNQIANCIQNKIQSRMDSISSSTACGLQQIIDKFSPLKHHDFENKYVQKRSMERASTRRPHTSQHPEEYLEEQQQHKLSKLTAQFSPNKSDSQKPSERTSVCPSPMNIAHVVPQPIQQRQMPLRILDSDCIPGQVQRQMIIKEAEDQIQRIHYKLNQNYVEEMPRKSHQMFYENEVEMFDQSQRHFDLANSTMSISQVVSPQPHSLQRNSKLEKTNNKSVISQHQVYEIEEESSNYIDETERSKTASVLESQQPSSKDTAKSFQLQPQKVVTGRGQILSQQSIHHIEPSNTSYSLASNPCSQPQSPPRVRVDKLRMQNELKQRMKNKENPSEYIQQSAVNRNKSRRSRGERNQSSQKVSNRVSEQQRSTQTTIDHKKVCTSILKLNDPGRNEYSCLTSPAHKKTPSKQIDHPYAASSAYNNSHFGTLSNQKKRLSQAKKSTQRLSKDGLLKPVLQEKRQNNSITSPKQYRIADTFTMEQQKEQSTVSLSIMSPSQAGQPVPFDPMQQIQKAIQTMMDQQKTKSPRKAQKLQDMIMTLQSQVNEMNDML